MKEYATIYKQDLELLKKLLKQDDVLAGEIAIAILDVPEEEKLIQNPYITEYIKQKRNVYSNP